MSHRTSGLYWSVVSLLVAFGLLGLLTIGTPFLLVGLALMILAPYRRRPGVFWSGIVAVVLFIAGFILVAPLGAPRQPTLPGQSAQSHTTCSNVLGLDYSGSGAYNPASGLRSLLASWPVRRGER